MKKYLAILAFFLPLVAGASSVNTSPTNSLTDGLVGYWTFDGKDTNWNSNITNDLSGQGNFATTTAMSTTTSPVMGKVGQGLRFDGTSNGLWVTNGTSLDNLPNADMTVAAWIYDENPITTNVWGTIFSTISVSSVGWAFRTYSDGTGRNLVWQTNHAGADASIYYSNYGTLPLKKWTHVMAVWTASSKSAKLYINGVEPTYLTQTPATTAYDDDSAKYPTIGILALVGGVQRFKGNIDDVRIYNRALSSAEITQLYKLGSARINSSPTTYLTNGLVGYWTMDGKDTNWSTGKTSDVSGTGNTGQLTNMSTTTSPNTGKVGQGFVFNGVNSYVNVGNNIKPTALTYSAWIKAKSFSNAYNSVISKDETGTVAVSTILVKSNGKLALYLTGTGGSTFYDGTGTYTLTTGKWYHLVLSYDANQGLIGYVNGSVDGTAAAKGNVNVGSTETIWIGSHPSISGRYFDGVIDETRIYNRALSADEIKQLYNLTR